MQLFTLAFLLMMAGFAAGQFVNGLLDQKKKRAPKKRAPKKRNPKTSKNGQCNLAVSDLATQYAIADVWAGEYVLCQRNAISREKISSTEVRSYSFYYDDEYSVYKIRKVEPIIPGLPETASGLEFIMMAGQTYTNPRNGELITIPTAIVAAGMFDTTDPSVANFRREPSSSLIPAEPGFLAGSRETSCKYIHEGDGFDGPHMNCVITIVSRDSDSAFWQEEQMQFVPKPSWWTSSTDATEEQLAGLCPCSRSSFTSNNLLNLPYLGESVAFP